MLLVLCGRVVVVNQGHAMATNTSTKPNQKSVSFNTSRTKNIKRLLLFAFVFALLGGGYFLYRSFAATTSTAVYGADYFGVSRGNLQWMDDATRRAKIDELKSIGVRWLRIDIMWSNIQYDGPASYNWTAFDKLVDDLNARGIKIMADITYTPPWALPSGVSVPIDEANKAVWEHYGPRNASDYSKFARAVAKHYKGKIDYFEIWNEANNYDYYLPKPDVAKYSAMLRGSYTVIKEENPNAIVISSGLAPYGEPGQVSSDGRLINPVTFLQRMYQNGVKGHFDALGWHPYNWGSGPPSQQRPWNAWYQMFGTNPSARSVMKANGEDKRIWITEWGYPSLKNSSSVADEALQAQYLKEGYQLAQS
jgi:hypothetical protein